MKTIISSGRDSLPNRCLRAGGSSSFYHLEDSKIWIKFLNSYVLGKMNPCSLQYSPIACLRQRGQVDYFIYQPASSPLTSRKDKVLEYSSFKFPDGDPFHDDPLFAKSYTPSHTHGPQQNKTHLVRQQILHRPLHAPARPPQRFHVSLKLIEPHVVQLPQLRFIPLLRWAVVRGRWG